MGYLDPTALAEVRRSDPRIYPVLTVTWPDQVRRYTTLGLPISSDTLGPIEPLVAEWSDFENMASDYSGNLQGVQMTVTLDDLAGVIQSLRRGRYQRILEGSPVSICYASPNIAAAAWPIRYTGIIANIERVSTYRYRLTFRTDDRALQGAFQWPRLGTYDFAGATGKDVDSVNKVSTDVAKFINVFLGRMDSNDSTTLGTVGSLQAYRLNRSDGGGGFAYRYLAAFPWIVRVTRVVVDGIVLATTAWRRTYSRFNGLNYTEIWLATDPGSAAVVTFDGTGPGLSAGANYPGSDVSAAANPITNPVSQMRWVLQNGVFNAYRSGSFFGDGSRIDTTSWSAAESFAIWRVQRGCIPPADSPETKPIDVLTAWAKAWHYSLYWTPTGKLGISPLEPLEPVPFWDEPRHLRFPRVGTEDAFIPNNPAKNRQVQYLSGSSWTVPTQAPRAVLTVKDPLIGGPLTEVSDNIFAEPKGAIEPILMPSSCKGFWAADHAESASVLISDGTVVGLLDSYGSNDLTGTGSPTIQMNKANGRALVKCESTGKYLVGAAISNFMTADKCTAFIVFRLRAATLNSASWWLNHPIFADNANVFGVFVKKTSNYELYAAGFDGTGRVTPSITIGLDQWYVAKFRHEAGAISLTVDNWTEVSTACGSFSLMTGLLSIGGKSNTAIYTDVDIAAVTVFNDYLTGQGNDAYTTPGLSADHDIWLDLSDRYIPETS